MSRYIDADALIKELCSDCALFLDQTCDGNRISCYPSSIVREQPTVDAVPVRCKDCKYCYAEGFVNVRNVCEKHYDFGNVDDDWFCADGERRSDEQQSKG